ncbi:vitamin K epoxide reductase family protein [Flavobacterium sp.]|uniref:vitamin K epoxide reductase family protein n=1 Tax=Flavobacterium sp. TaxID=239 RepID=UPI004048CCC7
MLKLVIKYLQNSNYSSKVIAFEQFYQSHPNYPSLLAITDGLSFLNIENIAANVPFEHFDELTNSFITELKFDESALYLLTRVESEFSIEDEEGKVKIISREEVEKHWTGIVLLVEENENDEIVNSFKNTKSFLPGFLVILILLSISIQLKDHLHTILLIIAGIGVFVTKEILETYFAKDKKESKFCTISEEFSCDSIIKSKSYTFSKYVEFVDLPVLFFSFSFIALLFGLQLGAIIGLVSLLSFPVLIYSIYLQKFSLKKWCLLCLVISGLLIANGILFLMYFNVLSFTIQNTINALLLISIIGFSWFLLKKWIQKGNENEVELNALLRFKRNEEVFYKTSESITNVDQFNALEKITIGETSAKNVISLFLSPSCPHCHTAYKAAKELWLKYPTQLKLAISYNLNVSNEDNPYLDIARSVLKLNNQGKDIIQALDDWHIEKMEMEVWKEKWHKTSDFNQENNQLMQQFQWCVDNEFNYAPVKIFNNYLMGQQYNIDELFYFFKD